MRASSQVSRQHYRHYPATCEKISGKTVTVVVVDKDRYGRLVGLVYDGCIAQSVNEEILKAGYAWVYRRYCNRDECRDWIQIEAQAKQAGIGLWRHKNPMPPWRFRRSRKR